MIYLRKFENHAAYEAAESSLILPNVSLCVNENEVHYNPSTPPTPQHDYVEIGGIKWATMNIGATGVTDGGLFFQWGDTKGYTAAQVGSGEGQKYFGWADYKYNPSGDGETMTKYNDEDGLTTLQAADDAVKAAWGGNWRMPTMSELYQLIYETNYDWASNYQGSGVDGFVFSGVGGTELFIPQNGYAMDGEIINDIAYWTSDLYGYAVTHAYAYLYDVSEYSRYRGLGVRGVLDE